MSTYLVDIIILLIAAVIAVPASQTARLGAVPGFLLAGIAVGPSGLGLISNINEIGHLAEIGVVLLLFVIGIELKPSLLWQMRTMVFGLGSLQVLITGSVLGGLAYLLFELPLGAAVLVGPALALSSTAFVLQILTAQKTLPSTYGRTSLAILLLQDLAVVPLLVLIPLVAAPQINMGAEIGLAILESIVIVLLVIISGRYLLHPVLHRVALSGNPEVFTASAVLIVLGIALLTERAGLSMAMGAFLAGLLISDSFYRHQVKAEIQPFRGLLLGLFFMSMGMSFNLQLLFNHPLNALAMLAGLVALKILILFPLCYLFGQKGRTGWAVSLILAQSGEFALVVFSLAFQANILDQIQYQYLLLLVLSSMLITPALANMALRLVKNQGSPLQPEPTLDTPMVLAGYGRVGHRIGEILKIAEQPFVALDSDAALVATARAAGHPVFFGNVVQPELLKAVGAAQAKLIIVTLNDPVATLEVVAALRKTYPDVLIYARGHSLEQCRQLHALGASGIVSENIEASLELARMALDHSGIDHTVLSQMLNDFRITYQSQIYETQDDSD
ncbi:MAG: monovalent cation:proton antiporter-2 (CPA2) family protein [Gammaproteobacteria bacterium]|nr:monovalent cation:proton antiporter-2 (CPA2) family protein [Gammaproteobacteria bacterium]MDH5799593.1 monovalent cation:proton antiporter-2 (CPA2) family protein [Gammaproteobacteria bacterium]